MKKTLYLLSILVFFISCKTYNPYTEEMKNKLEEMYVEDQEIQKYDNNRLDDQAYLDSMNLELEKICIKNTLIVKEYFKNHSYPFLNVNDEKTAKLFWLIVQHSDHDLKFQRKVLKSMRRGLQNNTVVKRNYAYLHDRVMKNSNKKQLYGTQIDWTSGKPIPFPIKNENKVNNNRKKMGLETLEEYLQRFSK